MADETAQTAKRALEGDTEATEAAEEDVQAVKKQKTEGGEAAAGEGAETAAGVEAATADQAGPSADADAEMSDDDEAAAEAADGDAAAAEAADAPAGGPVKLGYRTFNHSGEAADYLHDVLKKATPHRKLNEYESVMLLDLLQMGHPNAEQKLSGGLRAFVVAERRVDGTTTVCFHVKRLDNTLEDFSYRKCLATLFPEYVLTNPTHENKGGRGGKGGRGSGGRGGGGRGSGGRGRGGSGGRGRGGRGRGRGGRGRGH